MRLLPRAFRIIGLIISAILSFLYVFVKFIKEQPARVKFTILGVILALILFFILVRYGKVWIHNKLSAMTTAKELNINGKTKPLFKVVITMFYIFYPTLLLVLFLFGMQMYNGKLWLDILTLLGGISVYFIFEFIALCYERYILKQEQLRKINKENEDIAERVAKKINFEVKK